MINDTMSYKSTFSEKIKLFVKLLTYFLRLYYGVLTGKIYVKWVQPSTETTYFDSEEILKELDYSIDEILQKNLSPNYIDVEQRKGHEHIGYGCFITRVFGQPVMFTQGDATFFFSTLQKKNYTLEIIFQSFVPMHLTVKISDKKILKSKIPIFSKRKIKLEIGSTLISDEISKITISTDRLWALNYIDSSQYFIPLGIAIKKIEIK